MSLAADLLNTSFYALAGCGAAHETKVTIRDTGTTFSALMLKRPPVDPDMILGADPREATILKLPRADVPDEVRIGTTLIIEGSNMRITQREDTPGDPYVTYSLKVL